MSEKHVRILKEARRLIAVHDAKYVCCAIKDAAERLYKVYCEYAHAGEFRYELERRLQHKLGEQP